MTTILRGCIAAILSLAATSASGADARLLCDPTGDCADPCVYFPKGVTFHAAGPGALLKHDGVVVKLRLISERTTRQLDPLAELPGHTTVARYSRPGLRVELESTLANTSCFFKNEKGVYQESESCCGGKSEMKLRVTKGRKTQVYTTTWPWGC